jgi:hypothetical protein
MSRWIFNKKDEIRPLESKNMADHLEPEENEIAGPVLLSLVILAIIIIIIYFWAS